MILLLVYASVDGFDSSKFWWESLSGALGIVAGMSNPVVTELTGSSTAGLVVFFLCALVVGGGFVKGDVKWATINGVLMLTVLTVFSSTPEQLCGVAGAGALEALIRVMIAYGIGIVLNWALGTAAAKVAGGSKEEALETGDKAA